VVEKFEEVYVQHFQYVYRFLLGLCRNASLAEEIAQETFVRAMTQWEKFRGNCAVNTWLCSIAKNIYFAHLKHKCFVPLEEQQTPAGLLVEEAIFADETQLSLHRLLHKLLEPYKEVFALRVFSDLSYQQIGMLFDKTDSWARVTFYRAKALLQAKVREEKMDEQH
jgi:RNA polymerase sigma-70 factor (ECF subfamily)